MTTKFPHLLAAVEARSKHLNDAEGKDIWAIGAAVIKDCGGAATFGAERSDIHNGKGKMLEAAAKDLLRHGYEYTAGTLNTMAQTVLSFPVSRRHADVNFFCHAEAKNPDMLDWIISQVGKDEISGRVVREHVVRWHALQSSKHREQIASAKAKKKAAATLEEKRAAAAEIKRLGTAMPVAKTQLPPADKKSQNELATMADILDIDNDAVSMLKTLRTNLSELRKYDEVSADLTDALVEHHEQVAEVATQIANLMSKVKRGRFATIEGGKSA